jgi:putative membrane protein
MEIVSKVMVAVVAAIHIFILYLEMFAWLTLGRKVFKGAMAPELFEPTKVLAANQGLYNGFLAAGLIWSLVISNVDWSFNVALFFLICVVVAGLYGTATASRKIFFSQALPAIIAILVLLCSHF